VIISLDVAVNNFRANLMHFFRYALSLMFFDISLSLLLFGLLTHIFDFIAVVARGKFSLRALYTFRGTRARK
jgi:hypothetical protein